MNRSKNGLHKTGKRVLTAMIAIGMLASYTAFNTGFYNNIKISANAAVSESVFENDGFTFIKNDDGNTLSVTDYKGTEINVVIPSEYDGKPVTGINDGAFHDCNKIESITMPDSLVSIGNRAFYGCYKLTEITIPKNVEQIGESPFIYCSALAKINVAEGNKTFKSEDGVLYNNVSKKLVQFPSSIKGEYSIIEGTKIIGAGAFRDADIEWLTIPASLEEIEESSCDVYTALYYCYNLKGFSVEKGSENFAAYDDALYNIKDKELVQYPMGKEPGLCKVAEGTKSIGSCAFYLCSNVTEIILPDGLETIKPYAFESSESFKSIDIPNSVTEIGTDAFNLCKYLENINVGENNTVYSSDDGVLYDKAQTKLILCPQNKAGSYEISETTKIIDTYAFNNCGKLTDIKIPDGVEVINECGIRGCEGLKEIELPDSVVEIGDNAFQWCTNLESIKLSNSLETISKNAFDECHKLKSVVIPESVTTIDEGAFTNCGELEKVVIPKTVTSITDEYYPIFKGSENVVIYGYKGSYAEAYAEEKNIKFVAVNDISNDNFTVVPIGDQTETGEPLTPLVVVMEDEKTLVEGEDYTAEYQNNINAGTATVVITGTGDYFGTREVNFEILAKPVNSDTSEESEESENSEESSQNSADESSKEISNVDSSSSIPDVNNSSTDRPATGDSTIPVFIASVLAVISGITAWFISRRKKSKQ